MPHHSVGVEISKAHLDVYWIPQGKWARFGNNAAGFKALSREIDGRVGCLAYEPTGSYHLDFEEALLKAGLPLARVNPWQARNFVQALGRRVKTDAIDAQGLAQMAAAMELRPTPVFSKRQRQLKELQVAREALIQDRTRARNRRQHLRSHLLKRHNKARLRQIEQQLGAVDTEIQRRLQEEEPLARRAEILRSIPGLSSVTAAGLLTEMPELGTLTAKTAASLAGLAPVTRQSGTWRGRSFLQGGRSRVRRLLYMPALSAIRCHPRSGPEVRGPSRAGQAAQSGPCRCDAQAHHSGQRPDPAGPPLVGLARLGGGVTTRRRVGSHPELDRIPAGGFSFSSPG